MHDFGKSRDRKVLEGIEKFKYMNTNQIASLYFINIKNEYQRLQKASTRLKVMYDRGYVKRYRFPSEPYIYTLTGGKYTNRLQHYLTIVDIWIELQKIIPSGCYINCETEIKQGNVVTDLAIYFKNNFKNEHKEYYIEVEINSNSDILEKLSKYKMLLWKLDLDNENTKYEVIILCKHKRTINRIAKEYLQGEPFYYYLLSEFPACWTW